MLILGYMMTSIKLALKFFIMLDDFLSVSLQENGAPDRNRTCGLTLRRGALYPTELRALKGT